MKNTISVTILLTLLLIPRADAQQEYIVRTVYFQPTDSKDRSEWLDLDSIMKSIQDTYQSEMERHGFSGKIFRLETDQDGKVIVHKIKGRHNKAHYSGDTLPIVIEELESKGYNNRQSIYVIVMAGMQALWHNFAGGIATARPSGGWVGNSEYYGFCASVETSRGQVEDVIRHELGHTFGLQHIALYDPSDFIMGSGDTLSFHEARWLSRNHYFNRVWNYNLAPDLTEFHGAEVFENDKIRFRATASDESSMFQAYGFVSTNIVGWNFFEAASDFGVIATIDFTDIDRVHLNADKIYFQLMDADGNWRYHNPKTYTLPERHSDTPVNDRKQSPDCVLCDLGGFQRDLSDELNDLLNPREDIALTFEYAAENALTPINSSREWDGWVIGVWEKQPDRLVPAKSPYYFNFPEMNDLSHWMYSHAPSKIVYDVSDKECKSFGTYFILPQSCTKGMEFTAHADDIEIFAQDMYLPDYGTYIEFEIPEDTKTLIINISDMGQKDCDHYVLGEPKLFKQEEVSHIEINADVNEDGYVDLSDVLIVKSGMQNSVSYDTDINNDGVTDSIDLMIVKAKALQAIAAAAPSKQTKQKMKITSWATLKLR